MTAAVTQDRIAGAIAGMVLGDAFGVPGELWPRQKVRERFGDIQTFLDGPKDNIVACYFTAGHYTDDSAQAFVILKELLRHGCVPEPQILAQKLIEWVISMNGFEINLLGPSSKAALTALAKGEEASAYTKVALTNGAAMRIAPVGCFFAPGQEESLCRTVAKVSSVTHGTDVTIAGAAMVAEAVCCCIAGLTREEVIAKLKFVHDYAKTLGEPTWAASIWARLSLALEFMKTRPDEETMSQWIYDVLGTGTMTSESVTAALAVAFYAEDPKQAAHMCANMGGDTDTIGAMACAVLGARCGLSDFDPATIEYLEQINDLNFSEMAAEICEARKTFQAE